jgi:hypothetical protein
MILLVSLPFGATLGAMTWAALRGRGGLLGLLLSFFFGAIAALVGTLAAQALLASSTNAALGTGAILGALAHLLVGVAALGGRRRAHVRAEGPALGPPRR